MSTELLTEIATSQAPWMLMCVALIIYIIKSQDAQLKQLVVAVGNVALSLASHDSQAKDIKEDVKYIREHLEDKVR